MRILKKKVKVIKVGAEGCGIILPKMFAEFLEIKKEEKVELILDIKKGQLLVKKVD